MHFLNAIFKRDSLFVRITALSLTVVCAVMAMSQTVFAKTTYVITDGDQVTVHSTYASDPADVLNEASSWTTAIPSSPSPAAAIQKLPSTAAWIS